MKSPTVGKSGSSTSVEAAHAPTDQGLYQDPLMTSISKGASAHAGSYRPPASAPWAAGAGGVGDGGAAGARAAGGGVDAPAEGEWVSDLRPSWRNPLPPLLLTFSTLGFATVLTMGGVGMPDEAEARYLLRECGTNILMAAFCFGLADTIAQALQNGGNVREFVFSRTCKVVGLGMFMNGVVCTAWMHRLNKLLPMPADFEVESWHSFTKLLSKSLLDDLLWGVVANSTGIFARRLLDGDTVAQAGSFWHSCILRVTLSDFQFWPLWGMVNFALVPHPFNVMFSTVGSLLWQIYMSVVSNWEKFARTHSGTIPPAAGSWDSSAGGKWKQVVHVSGGYQNV